MGDTGDRPLVPDLVRKRAAQAGQERDPDRARRPRDGHRDLVARCSGAGPRGRATSRAARRGTSSCGAAESIADRAESLEIGLAGEVEPARLDRRRRRHEQRAHSDAIARLERRLRAARAHADLGRSGVALQPLDAQCRRAEGVGRGCDPPRAGRWPRARAHRDRSSTGASTSCVRTLATAKPSRRTRTPSRPGTQPKNAAAGRRHHSQSRRTPATSRPAAPSQTGGSIGSAKYMATPVPSPTGSHRNQRSRSASRLPASQARRPGAMVERRAMPPTRPRLAAWSGRCAIAVFVLDHAPTSRLHGTAVYLL